ncbi:hypothetical protein [Reichenbachiella ulvae]|uniref:Lipocalin-like domain-containing protein n=1 Tax=Reichenbachiella ulvae TaxID=2980104 RepID=A0ABT3CPT3_9BACT|nr:hypothetical protein [Reichenbachiella ulvae]MCV9385720.1 hypothetical protein [Reichenbachiella ulvae]
MKSTIAIWVAAMTFSVVSYAQPQKVKERDLGGVWQMKIELGEDFIEKEIEKEDDVMARIIMQATGSFVDGILDELDIKFRFLDDNVCKIYVSAFGSESEVETGEWYINSKGQLIISDTDSYQSDGDEYWMMQDDILIAMEDGEILEDDAKVYMVRISD